MGKKNQHKIFYILLIESRSERARARASTGRMEYHMLKRIIITRTNPNESISVVTTIDDFFSDVVVTTPLVVLPA